MCLIVGLAVGCEPADACRAVGLTECPTPTEPATPYVGTPSPFPIGAPPVIVAIDPDPIVTYAQDDFILCIQVDDPDQGNEIQRIRMWLDPAEYDVAADWVLWNIDGISQTFCWATYSPMQNNPLTIGYLHIEARDVMGNPHERVVQWRALP